MFMTLPGSIFLKWHINVVSILQKGMQPNYMIVAQESITGWVEGRAFSSPTAAAVAKFIYKDIFCQHSIVDIVVSDRGLETKDVTEQLWKKYGTKIIQISPYNHKANGFIEVRHKPIMMALHKLTQATGL